MAYITEQFTPAKDVLGNFLLFAGCAIAGLVLGFLIQRNPVIGVIAAIGITIAVATLRWPGMGTYIAVFAIYSNVVVALQKSNANTMQNGLSALDQGARLGALAIVLPFFAVPLLNYLVFRRMDIIVDRALVLMVAFLGDLLVSSVFARDQITSLKSVIDFLLEGVGIYFALINIVRDVPTLRRVVWALLLAGAFMGTLSVIQEATHTKDNNYLGLAQRGGLFEVSKGEQGDTEVITDSGETVDVQTRSAGPIGEQNRYAQILLVLLPLALVYARWARPRLHRLFARFCFVAILGGVILTFSRGAFVAVVAMSAVMVFLGYTKWYKVAAVSVMAAVLVVVAMPDYVTRISSIGGVGALFSKQRQAQKPDFSTLRRYAENLACLHTFATSPIIGVGPGQFQEYYSEAYVNQTAIVRQTKGFRGHSMYLEAAAETGILGLSVLLLIFGAILHHLWRQYRVVAVSYPEWADVMKAMMASIIGYMVSAIFLQLSYQRYLWLLLALASIAANMVPRFAKSASTRPAGETA